MSKIQRNAPCPCGSGRKYKKCCLAADNKAATERLNNQRVEQEQREQELRELSRRQRESAISFLNASWIDDDERVFMDLTNGVIDLVNDERFDEALANCQRLLDDYPETIDGLDRSGIVHEAQGNHLLAADFYRRCLDFIQQPEQQDCFEQASIDFYREKVEKMDKLAQTP